MRTTEHSHGRMSLHEYLAWEEQNQIKHEYLAGEAYAMVDVTVRHNLITLNIATSLRPAARKRGCRVLTTDVKLRVGPDRIYYPDIMAVCGSAAAAELIVDAPAIVVEVTSPSTRGTDRREKLEAYTRLPSLRSYLIVEQRRRRRGVVRPDGRPRVARRTLLKFLDSPERRPA